MKVGSKAAAAAFNAWRRMCG